MDDNTLLHRQVHPNFVQNKNISIQVFLEQKDVSSLSFTPNENDQKKLSVYNGEKFSPEKSYEHYKAQGKKSMGVLSLTKEECESVTPLSVDEDNNPYDGHTIVDFTLVEGDKQIKARAVKLRNIAIVRHFTFIEKG